MRKKKKSMAKTKKQKNCNSSVKKLCLSREQLEDALRLYRGQVLDDLNQLENSIDHMLEENNTDMATVLSMIKFIKQASLKLVLNGQLVVNINDDDYPLIYLHSILKSQYETDEEA